MAESAAKMTGTTVDHKLVGSAWPPFFNKVVAEVQQKNIEAVGMPKWSDADQTLAKALQKEIGAKVDGLKEKVEPLEEPVEESVGRRLRRCRRYFLERSDGLSDVSSKHSQSSRP